MVSSTSCLIHRRNINRHKKIVRKINLNHLTSSKTGNRCVKCYLKFGIISGFALLFFSSLTLGDSFSDVSPTEPWPKPQPMRSEPPPSDILHQLLPKVLPATRGLPTLLTLPATSLAVSLFIRFEFASARLKPESIETLRYLGNALNQELKDEDEKCS